MMPRRFVAYLLIDPRGDRTPFYIGIGKPTRPAEHLKSVLTGVGLSNGWKVSIIRDILASGAEPEFAILEWFDDFASACEYEIAAIAACRAAGIEITNQHPGGLLSKKKIVLDKVGVAKRWRK